MATAAALAIAASAGMCERTGEAPYLARAGRAASVIVLPDDATPGETYAAKELIDHVKQISGAELSQTSESLYSSDKGRIISMGRTQLSRKHVTDEQLSALGDDGYRVFCKGGDAFFVGGRKRGSMYAVYEYLESLGVRWYSPTYTVIPKLPDVRMPSKGFQYVPKLQYRCQYWDNGITVEWLARMRLNGNIGEFPEVPESMGGCITAMYSCHSYRTLVPPDQYFKKHPEWYAIKPNGRRSEHELCLTNKELRDHVTSKVLSDLRACSGKVERYWVSQNDGGLDACFCEKCTAERVAHGDKNRWSANTISFVSDVAERVKKEFPRTLIKTLAYSYTNQAPENMKASDQVLVEICGNFGPGIGDHEKTVKAWSGVAKNLSVYTYGGSNYGYWWPYPNLYELGMQPVWALQNGVNAFYVQGTAIGKGSGLVDVRAYLTARMAWDPSRDVNKEVRDFCNAFYGPAGKYIVQYHNAYVDYLKRRHIPLYGGWGEGDAWRVWVTRDIMDDSDAIFQKALAAVKDNPTYLAHVRRVYLEVLWGQVMLALKPTTTNKAEILPGMDVKQIRAKARLFGEIMRENNYTHLGEWLRYVPGDNLLDSAAKE